MSGGLFGRPRVGEFALVDPPVSQWYARRAGIAAVVAGLSADVLVTAVSSVFCQGFAWHGMPGAGALLAVAVGLVAGVLSAVSAAVLVRVWPVLRVLWWWSFEITAAVFAVGGPVALAHVSAWWVAVLAVVLVVAAVVAFRRVRGFVWAWSWCLVDRHRLRVAFANLARNRSGSGGASRPVALPLMLWARPTPAGERVWLWLRPGFAPDGLDGKDGLFAVTCWAKQVRIVAATERFAGLLRVDVSRRDPLLGLVSSPLALLIPSLRDSSDIPVSPAVVPVGLDLDDIPEPPDEPPSRGGRR